MDIDKYSLFEVANGFHAIPIVASIPHSGLYVPPDIASQFTPEHLAWLRNTDWFIHEVFDFLPTLGVTTIKANFSRYVVDLNRDVGGCLYGPFGKAPVADILISGQKTHNTPPSEKDLNQRITLYHEPYHQALAQLLDRMVKKFGRCLLLDLHAFMGPSEYDVCLGNLHGRSCEQDTIMLLSRLLTEQGFDTSVNKPFSGQYILNRHHIKNIEALQFELRYTNYMDCTNIDIPQRPSIDKEKLKNLQPRLISVLNKFIKIKTHYSAI